MLREIMAHRLFEGESIQFCRVRYGNEIDASAREEQGYLEDSIFSLSHALDRWNIVNVPSFLNHRIPV